ncbi:MAG: hypothetical protein H0U95_14875 [Bacteroidetes bacterium]|nr:hypothetical protein [Bacteroidota bacterium]
MKKLQLQVLILASVLGLNAQIKTDSLKRFRLSGIIVEMHGISNRETSNNNQADFQKHVQNNELLDKDLTAYSTYSGYNLNFEGMFSARAFFECQKAKRHNPEVFIGLRYGNAVLAGASYFKLETKTVATYINPVNKDSLQEVDLYNTSYRYQINSKSLFIPLGINIATNKTNRLWFSAGVEISPGITFNNTFSAYYLLTKNKAIYEPNTSTPFSANAQGATEILDSKYSNTQLKGVGFEGYLALPLSANLRVSKKIKFLKQLNLNGALAPGFFVSKNKFASTQTNFIANASLGIRYNW